MGPREPLNFLGPLSLAYREAIKNVRQTIYFFPIRAKILGLSFLTTKFNQLLRKILRKFCEKYCEKTHFAIEIKQ